MWGMGTAEDSKGSSLRRPSDQVVHQGMYQEQEEWNC